MYLVLSSCMWSPTNAASSLTLLNISMSVFCEVGAIYFYFYFFFRIIIPSEAKQQYHSHVCTYI
jgi:hypothetical protein